MSVITAASSVSSASVRCDLCCRLLPSAAALTAHAASCFEQLSQAFNSQLTIVKGDWNAHTQAVLAASKPSLHRRDDPLEERQLLVQHAHSLLQMMETARDSAAAPAAGSDALTVQLLQLKATHAHASLLRQFSQQLLSQLPTSAALGATDVTSTRLLLAAGIQFCSCALLCAELRQAGNPPPSAHVTGWELGSLAPLSLPELTFRFIDALAMHSQAAYALRMKTAR
jgi:hypothetical protein